MFCPNANDSFKCVSGFFFFFYLTLCVPFLLDFGTACVHRQCVTFERMTQWRRLFAHFFHIFFSKKFILLCLWQFIHLSPGSWLSHLIRFVRFINEIIKKSIVQSPTFTSSNDNSYFILFLHSKGFLLWSARHSDVNLDNCISNYASDIDANVNTMTIIVIIIMKLCE